MKEIGSTQNSLIKLIISLNNKKNIVKHKVTFVEGEKIINELLVAQFDVKTILVTQEKLSFLENKNLKNTEIVLITPQVAKKISETVTNAGVFAVVGLPVAQPFNPTQPYLVLDNVQDPTNVGSVVRSALAFGVKQIILIDGAYAYLPKTIRTSMGYVFATNIFALNEQEFLQFSKTHNLNLLGASMHGENINNLKHLAPKHENHGFVAGNEGQGIRPSISKLCKKFVAIPMQNGVESLNVAVSVAIILHEINKN